MDVHLQFHIPVALLWGAGGAVVGGLAILVFIRYCINNAFRGYWGW